VFILVYSRRIEISCLLRVFSYVNDHDSVGSGVSREQRIRIVNLLVLDFGIKKLQFFEKDGNLVAVWSTKGIENECWTCG
jgi:hypothetical protein